MDPIVWAALISGITALVTSGINVATTIKNNRDNADINQKNLDFNAAQTQEAWERDDTYYQRSVEDAKAAGLSPLAINGAMPNTAPLSSPSPIAMQAPQIDTNSMIQALLESSQLQETKRHNISEENLRADEIKNTAKEIKLKADRLNLDNKDVESQIKYRASMADLESKRLAETVRANKEKEKLETKKHELEKASFESKRYFEEIKHQAGGENVPYKVYDNFDAYLTARDIYLTAFNNFIDEVGLTRQAKADSSQLGFNAGGSYLGTGANAGVSNNESAYDMKDWSQQNEIAWKKFQQKYPVPIYYYKGN